MHASYIYTFTPTGNRCTYWVRGLVTALVVCFHVIAPAYLLSVITQNIFELKVLSCNGLRLHGVPSDYARSEVVTMLVVGSTILRQKVKQIANDKA